jgi:hypothetical protein
VSRVEFEQDCFADHECYSSDCDASTHTCA